MIQNFRHYHSQNGSTCYSVFFGSLFLLQLNMSTLEVHSPVFEAQLQRPMSNFILDSLRRSTKARNVLFDILRWLIYLIDLAVDNSLYCSTFPSTQHTVYFETKPPSVLYVHFRTLKILPLFPELGTFPDEGGS